MAAIREVAAIASKWATVTPQRVGDYNEGVANPKKDWKTATAAASETFKQAMQQVIAQDLFKKGVARSSTEVWQEAAGTKGAQRWGPGVQLAESKYATNFAPYRDAIARVTLPPRFARRDPRNMARMQAVVKALVEAKERAGGAGG